MKSINPTVHMPLEDKEQFKTLFKIKPQLHSIAMVYNWLIIITTAYLYQELSISWLYPLVVIIIGARMHALTILMHDATHYRFLKNKRWNDLVSNFFIMYPVFTSIEKYRANHLMHHQHLNSTEDPDWVAKLTKREFQFPKTKSEFLFTVASYLVLYQGILDAIWFAKRYGQADKKDSSNSGNTSLRIGFYILLFSSLAIFKLWSFYLLFWIVPFLTSFYMFQYIRSVAEHFGELAYEDNLSSSRTVVPSLLEKFFIAPHCVGYHLEHHLYPGIPFYHLPKAHQLLMRQENYQAKAHITKGYVLGLLGELGE